MDKINFQNGITPLNDTNLNQMQDNMEEVGVVVSPTEPTTNEKVWIDDTHKKLYVRNDDGTYTVFYSEEEIYEKHNYSTEEQVIGTYLGKPLYRKAFNIGTVPTTYNKLVHCPNVETLTKASTSYYLGGIRCVDVGLVYINTDDYLYLQNDRAPTLTNIKVVLEYTKTTDA